MSDRSLPPDAPDEGEHAHVPDVVLASAAVDGLLDDVGRRRLAESPSALQWVTAMETIRTTLIADAATGTHLTEADHSAVRAALEALDGPTATAAALRPLARSRRRAVVSLARPVVAVAAAVVLLATAGGVALRGVGSSNDMASTSQAGESADGQLDTVVGPAAAPNVTATINGINDSAVVIEVIDSADDLSRIAATAADDTALDTGEDGVGVPVCLDLTDVTVVAAVIWIDVPAWVVIDRRRGEVIAVSADCQRLAVTARP